MSRPYFGQKSIDRMVIGSGMLIFRAGPFFIYLWATEGELRLLALALSGKFWVWFG